MAKSRKLSARQKLERDHGLPKVVDIPERMQRTFGPGKMLIARPLDVDALIRTVPRGKLTTVRLLREKLARDAGAHVTCPLTTGIFLRISAEAAEEDRAGDAGPIAPYWRVVKDDGGFNPKFPGGVEAHAELVREEGHGIVTGRNGKPRKVKGLDRALSEL